MPTLSVPAAATGLPFVTPAALAASPHAGLKPDTQHRALGHRHGPAHRIVLFRVDRLEDGTPRTTAVFPCEPAEDGQMVSFTRSEGYVPCSQLWVDMSAPAKPRDYVDLLAYLQAKGDVLDIRHRITPAMEETRRHLHAEARSEARRLALQAEAREKAETAAAEASAFRARCRQPGYAACHSSAKIVASLTGMPEDHVGPDLDHLPKASPARWVVMFLAHSAFGTSTADIAGVYGRSADGVERAIRRVDDMQASNRAFRALLRRLLRAARGKAHKVAAAAA